MVLRLQVSRRGAWSCASSVSRRRCRRWCCSPLRIAAAKSKASTELLSAWVSFNLRHLPRPQRKILSRDTAARTYLQPRGVCSAQHFVDGAVLLARRCALRVYRRARGASRALTRSAARRGAEHTLGRCCAPGAAEAVAEGGKHAHCQIRLRSGWLSTPAGGAGRTPLSI